MPSNQFNVNDLYLAACLLIGIGCFDRVERNASGSYSFIFNLTNDDANEILKEHLKGELIVPTREFVLAINILKGRLRHGS